MKSPIPHLKNINNVPENGTVCKTHVFCRQVFNSKCKEHYKSCSSTKGFHVCPYGFATYVSKNNNSEVIYTSLRVRGVSKEKWLKKRLKKNESNPLLTKDSLVDLIKESELLKAEHTYSRTVVRDIDKKETQVNSKKELLDDTLHELRRINKQLKKQAFFLEKELSTENFDLMSVRDKSKNVLSAAQLVSVRLNAYDFTLNPGLVETGLKADMNLYKKFEKARYCLSVFAQEQGNSIDFIGSCHDSTNAYEILEILPYVLLENALRYSPKGTGISCKFNLNGNKLASISVENIGPIIQEDELPTITEKGERAKSVIGKIKGTGKGLYIVKLICDYHGFDLSIESEPINEILGIFRAKIKLNNGA